MMAASLYHGVNDKLIEEGKMKGNYKPAQALDISVALASEILRVTQEKLK